jgi:hypothetical protein
MEIYTYTHSSFVAQATRVVAASPCRQKPVLDGRLLDNAMALAKERVR